MQQNYDVKIVKAKDGSDVPTINNIYLHSAYNPTKEAIKVVDNWEETYTNHNELVIIGLGFKYHLVELIKRLKETHKDFRIMVIEPNPALANIVEQYVPYELENTIIKTIDNFKDFYHDKEIITFLTRKPPILYHPGTLNIYNDKIKNLLHYEEDNSIQSIKEYISCKELRAYLEMYEPSSSIKDVVTYIKNNNILRSRKWDHFLVAYDEIINKFKKKEIKEDENEQNIDHQSQTSW